LETAVTALLKLNIRVEAVRYLLVHVTLEIKQLLSEKNGVINVCLIVDDLRALGLDVLVHLLHDAGQVGFTARKALVEHFKVVLEYILDHMFQACIFVNNLLIALSYQLCLDLVHEDCTR